jgi:hypothetical protein
MNDSFNKIAIQSVLDKYGSREEALSRIYNDDGTVNDAFREDFVNQVQDFKKNTLFKYDN